MLFQEIVLREISFIAGINQMKSFYENNYDFQFVVSSSRRIINYVREWESVNHKTERDGLYLEESQNKYFKIILHLSPSTIVLQDGNQYQKQTNNFYTCMGFGE